MKVRRPRIVTLFVGLVLCFSAVNLLRFVLAWQTWELFAGQMWVSPAFLAVSGLVWFVVGLGVAAALWFGLHWAPLAAGAALVVYSVYFWAARLVPPGFTGRNSNGLFVFGVNVLVLAWAVWVYTRPKVRIFYGLLDVSGEEDEQRPEN